MAPVVCEPEVALLPDHALPAPHDVAFAALQVNVADSPADTVVLSTWNDSVGAVATLTCAVPTIDPPAPVHVSVKLVADCIGPTVSVPLVALAPLHPPDATQLVALVLCHASIVDSPDDTAEGDAEMLKVGTGAPLTVAIVTDCSAAPPGPVQVNV